MPCPCGASNEPITLPFLSIWIIAGGRRQQSAVGGLRSACPSTSVVSFGRFSTQTLSSLSTASPVTPPIFHLFGSGLGQSGSNLNFGADCCACVPRATNKPNKQRPANTPKAQFRRCRSILCFTGSVPPSHQRALVSKPSGV